MERQFILKQFEGRAFAGMTFKNAGNFYPNGSCGKADQDAKSVLGITGFLYLSDRLAIMRAEKHGRKVIYLGNHFNAAQLFCDGVIYSGKGAAVFFPGGCAAIAFRDERADISGMLHGGWKPVAQGIIEIFLRKWWNAGGSYKTTQIKFLPAICGNCLVFDTAYFKKVVSPAINSRSLDEFTKRINAEYISLDLSKFIEASLNGFGYNAENNASCVCCSGKYWCYRCDDKDGVKHRNAAFVITG